MEHEIALSGHGIRTVPLLEEHASALFDFVDPGMWAGMAAARPRDAAELALLVRARLLDPSALAFTVLDQRTGAVLGTTSLCDFVPSQQRIEIGGTFFGRQFWGSHANAASKNMLLGSAVETLGVHAVPAGYGVRTFAAL